MVAYIYVRVHQCGVRATTWLPHLRLRVDALEVEVKQLPTRKHTTRQGSVTHAHAHKDGAAHHDSVPQSYALGASTGLVFEPVAWWIKSSTFRWWSGGVLDPTGFAQVSAAAHLATAWLLAAALETMLAAWLAAGGAGRQRELVRVQRHPGPGHRHPRGALRLQPASVLRTLS